MFVSATGARFEKHVSRTSAYQEERVKTLNHKSFWTYHELSGAVCVNFAPGIANDIRREQRRADQAKQPVPARKCTGIRSEAGKGRHAMNFLSNRWICRNFIRIASTVGVLICLLIAALFWSLAQTMVVNAGLTSEVRELRRDQLTDRAMIRALADEQRWIREKVRITVTDK